MALVISLAVGADTGARGEWGSRSQPQFDTWTSLSSSLGAGVELVSGQLETRVSPALGRSGRPSAAPGTVLSVGGALNKEGQLAGLCSVGPGLVGTAYRVLAGPS